MRDMALTAVLTSNWLKSVDTTVAVYVLVCFMYTLYIVIFELVRMSVSVWVLQAAVWTGVTLSF